MYEFAFDPLALSAGIAARLIVSPETISVDIRAIQAWHDREFELTAIRELGENWDGYGADAPSVAVMDAASLFLAICKKINCTHAPVRIALSPSGVLSVDWLYGDTLVRAEIEDPNEIEWMKATPGRSTEFFTTELIGAGPEIEQVQTWQPAPVAEDELTLAYAR